MKATILDNIRWKRLGVSVVVGLAGTAMIGGLWWFLSGRDALPEMSAERDNAPANFGIDLRHPPESIDTFRHVLRTGGCRLTREAAIAWLDTHARKRLALSSGEPAELMDMLRSRGHPAWSPGYRQHLSNSALNVLQFCGDPSAVVILLRDLTLHDEDCVMRIYALQHLRSQRAAGRVVGEVAVEIHAMLESLAKDPHGDLSGTAIMVLAEWNGPDGDEAVQRLAAQTAGDRKRPVDIRIAAIHAAGAASLGVARVIAPDVGEPVILRKAAMARLGDYGDEGDLTILTSALGESARIAQAADPAIKLIRDRGAGRTRPAPIPYPSFNTTLSSD